MLNFISLSASSAFHVFAKFLNSLITFYRESRPLEISDEVWSLRGEGPCPWTICSGGVVVNARPHSRISLRQWKQTIHGHDSRDRVTWWIGRGPTSQVRRGDKQPSRPSQQIPQQRVSATKEIIHLTRTLARSRRSRGSLRAFANFSTTHGLTEDSLRLESLPHYDHGSRWLTPFRKYTTVLCHRQLCRNSNSLP